MQKIILENVDSFDLTHIFECGQCFRWNKQEDESYIGIVNKYVLNVSKLSDNKILIKCYTNNEENKDELFKFCSNYFDLGRNYTKIKKQLCLVDDNMKNSIEYGYGIRLLNQDLWETIISYIISANNNIPRIKGIIEKISKNYGECIKVGEQEFYTFPSPKQLSKASVKDLKGLGLGFRDVRVYETTKLILSKTIDLDELPNIDTKELKELLQTLPGVGPKVADCILLFSTLKRMEVFPIDVWVRRVMNDLYIHNPNEEKVNKKEIQKLAYDKFGNLAGIAQEYLYYWKRDK